MADEINLHSSQKHFGLKIGTFLSEMFYGASKKVATCRPIWLSLVRQAVLDIVSKFKQCVEMF